LGLVDYTQTGQVELLRRKCEESLTQSDVAADIAADVAVADQNCKDILNYIAKLAGDVDQMDSRYFNADNVPDDTFQLLFKRSTRLEELK
jgi:hypothetical protein